MISEEIKSVSIIGLGNFGRFVATLIAKTSSVDVMGFDPAPTELDPLIKRVDLGQAALADVVVLAIPLSKYEMVLEPLAKLISRQSLLIDVCSVKMEPERLIKEHLPDHDNLLLTHPLFGPRSSNGSLGGESLVVTHSHGPKAKKVLAGCKKLGLDIKRVSALEHDQAMRVHALMLFVAKGLENIGLEYDPTLLTPSSQMVLDLAEFSRTSSPDLIQTIQVGNPFAKEVRQKFIDHLQEIDKGWI